MDTIPLLSSPSASVGAQLRAWRKQRGRSQLGLALDAEMSQRHLSFLESGRARPSREMVMRLAETLDVPLRQRNVLLLAAGFAPVFPERELSDPGLGQARTVIEMILRAHVPNPALVVDRYWHMVSANAAVAPLIADVADHTLLQPPVNVLRLSLHPQGLAPQIVNFPEWRTHILDRLRRQAANSADQALADLLAELSALGSAQTTDARVKIRPDNAVAIPLELDTSLGRLSLISTTTIFGTPTEVTLSELVIEAFYPADEDTARRLNRLQPGTPTPSIASNPQAVGLKPIAQPPAP